MIHEAEVEGLRCQASPGKSMGVYKKNAVKSVVGMALVRPLA
jgi:hypothetical protein